MRYLSVVTIKNKLVSRGHSSVLFFLTRFSSDFYLLYPVTFTLFQRFCDIQSGSSHSICFDANRLWNGLVPDVG